MDCASFANCASFAIGLGGLLLGALTMYLSYLNQKEERRHSYRQVLYSKQSEGCAAIIKCAVEYEYSIGLLIAQSEQREINGQDKEKVDGAEKQFGDVGMQWLIFLPQAVNEAMSGFAQAASGLVSLLYAQQMVSKSNTADTGAARRKLDEAYWALVSSIRKTLAIEPLSSDTIRILYRSAKRSGEPFSENFKQKHNLAESEK